MTTCTLAGRSAKTLYKYGLGSSESHCFTASRLISRETDCFPFVFMLTNKQWCQKVHRNTDICGIASSNRVKGRRERERQTEMGPCLSPYCTVSPSLCFSLHFSHSFTLPLSLFHSESIFLCLSLFCSHPPLSFSLRLTFCLSLHLLLSLSLSTCLLLSLRLTRFDSYHLCFACSLSIFLSPSLSFLDSLSLFLLPFFCLIRWCFHTLSVPFFHTTVSSVVSSCLTRSVCLSDSLFLSPPSSRHSRSPSAHLSHPASLSWSEYLSLSPSHALSVSLSSFTLICLSLSLSLSLGGWSTRYTNLHNVLLSNGTMVVMFYVLKVTTARNSNGSGCVRAHGRVHVHIYRASLILGFKCLTPLATCAII